MTSCAVPRRSFWPYGIALFFAGIFALNFFLLFLAVRGYGGLLDTHPYEKGLVYDDELAKVRNFQRLGWTLSLDATPIRVVLHDRDGAPIRGGTVRLAALRPNDSSADTRVELVEVEPGIYTAPASLKSGLWLLRIEITQGVESAVWREQKVL